MMKHSLLTSTAIAAVLVGGSFGAEAAPFSTTGLTNTYVADPVSQSVFSSAGLGAKNSWTFLAQPLSFTQQAVSATYTLRSAAFNHRFGTASTGPTYNAFNVIFDSKINGVGSSKTVVGAADPFLFWFDTNQGYGSSDNGGAYTNGQGTSIGNGTHNIAVYVRNGIYALFYDDGGNAGHSDDNDYNDMVATVEIPEPATMAIFGAGLLGMGVAARRRKRA